MLFANVCAGFSFWYGVGGEWWFFGFLASPWYFVHLGGDCFASHPPCVCNAWVSKMSLPLYTPCGRSAVGALSLFALGEFAGQHKKLPV